MRWRQAGYVGEHRPRRIHRQPEQQRVADGEIIEAHGDARIAANASQHVADHDRRANACVIQRLHAEVIASADESPALSIPDTEREVAEKMRGAVGAPALVGGEHQLDIRRASQTLRRGATPASAAAPRGRPGVRPSLPRAAGDGRPAGRPRRDAACEAECTPVRPRRPSRSIRRADRRTARHASCVRISRPSAGAPSVLRTATKPPIRFSQPTRLSQWCPWIHYDERA